MPSRFIATEFSATEHDWGLVTALRAPSTEAEDFYLMLQRKSEWTKQDVRFGMDKPYIEYCGQGWSWYGHIESFELFRNHVLVRMDQAAASHMGNDGIIEVGFQLTEPRFAQLKHAMEGTFHGCNYFQSRV